MGSLGTPAGRSADRGETVARGCLGLLGARQARLLAPSPRQRSLVPAATCENEGEDGECRAGLPDRTALGPSGTWSGMPARSCVSASLSRRPGLTRAVRPSRPGLVLIFNYPGMPRRSGTLRKRPAARRRSAQRLADWQRRRRTGAGPAWPAEPWPASTLSSVSRSAGQRPHRRCAGRRLLRTKMRKF